MTREQAINYLISSGFTHEQVGDVVRALTYKLRDCANCKHYVVTDTRTNWGSQETTKIYGCECWECEYEPTTKNDSSELEKNSKKLEKDFGELVEIDLYSVIKQKYIEREVLDKIRAEIEGLTYYWCETNPKNVIDDVLEILDKYKSESEKA